MLAICERFIYPHAIYKLVKTMTKIENIRKWIKNKAGVSPIIAIILMVAITVVLAATIYVWVSGMGKGGTSAPSLSATADNVNHRLIISQADKGLKWSDITVTYTPSTGVTCTLYKVGTATGGSITSGGTGPTTAGDVEGGDYLAFSGTAGTTVTVTLTYGPTNTNFGTWTIYL